MRGSQSSEGNTRVSANGYHYTKALNPRTGKVQWRLTHHIIAEEKIGRPLNEDERVHFIDKKTNLSPDNIKVVTRGRSSLRRRLAQVEARIQELQAERDVIKTQLMGPNKTPWN